MFGSSARIRGNDKERSIMDKLLEMVLQDEEVQQMLVDKFKSALQDWKLNQEVLSKCLNRCIQYVFEDGDFYDMISSVAENALRERFGIEEIDNEQ